MNSIIFTGKKGKRGRKAKTSTKISREFIDCAVEDYLKKGGKITEIKPVKRSLADILASRESVEDVDEILGKM